MKLLSTSQMATFAAKGCLRFDGLIGDEINQKKTDNVKADKKVADSGSKSTKVETEPKVDYKN